MTLAANSLVFIYSGGKSGQSIHVKLGDFGFVKLLLEEENATMSYVGTREYLAPVSYHPESVIIGVGTGGFLTLVKECRRISMPIQPTPKSDVWAFGGIQKD